MEFSKRAVACKHWRWMPGMRVISKREGELEDVIQRVPDDMRGWRLYSEDAFPDLEDAATVGCLLHLVRKALNDECFASYRLMEKEDMWIASGHRYHTVLPFPRTEAEALVRAMEAAP
jgi:hypothetical protein